MDNKNKQFRVLQLTGTTVMATNIQVFVQVALLCCVVTTSMGVSLHGCQRAILQLETK